MIKLRLIILICAFINLAGCSDEIRLSILKKFLDQPKNEFFKVFHYLYNKEYDLNSEEGIKRFRIFKDKLKIIIDHNTKQNSYKLGVIKFADMTKEEFAEKYLMNPKTKRHSMENMIRNLKKEGYFDKFAHADYEYEDNLYSNDNDQTVL